ncbi:sulfatase family protein [Niabella ginsengisoli]|uniref:Arylsulfatase n=1 Tax=Niabella ginsengisoli TaxID=522298 RepID=A0ABS9SHQ4_9BACT|nr:arylsulfatase [Niabella ginsengisoli]MCH5597860.1 arylsulfatase [Niabella ginsengisoli]
MKKIIFAFSLLCSFTIANAQSSKPNVIFIYVDDLGYGDLSCYGATKIKTPNLDQLAAQGIRFTNGHSTSATCTPSRYALMTGQYPWRKSGTGVLPGDAALIIPTDRTTLPKVFKKAGYQTGIVGKWHLGLGDAVEKAWNGEIKPGPNETGFDYSFIFPATADRVPTVFIRNHNVVALDPEDPIAVSYKEKIGNEPTGKENPELLKLKSTPNHGHANTIVNGIGRIGFMTGGKLARWTDEELPMTFLKEAKDFIKENKTKPFFLCYNLTEPHVPRMPSTIFRGTSGLGLRGDAILQLDWAVGEIMNQLKASGIDKNTIVIFSSDNGPVLDDGYLDGAVTQLNGHTPWGPLRGGKYSALEAGTRVPFIISWPGKVKPAVSNALVCQIDFIASFAKLLNLQVPANDATDSENQLDALFGKTKNGRSVLVQQGISQLTIVKNGWKYIAPHGGPANTGPKLTNIETGNLPEPQLYDLNNDIGESKNLASKYPAKVKELAALLQSIKAKK